MTNELTRHRRGGQPGNQNALKHGRRSAAATLARKRSRAVLKAASHLLTALGAFPPGQEPRCRPLRGDQWAIVAEHEPELFALMLQYGT